MQNFIETYVVLTSVVFCVEEILLATVGRIQVYWIKVSMCKYVPNIFCNFLSFMVFLT